MHLNMSIVVKQYPSMQVLRYVERQCYIFHWPHEFAFLNYLQQNAELTWSTPQCDTSQSDENNKNDNNHDSRNKRGNSRDSTP